MLSAFLSSLWRRRRRRPTFFFLFRVPSYALQHALHLYSVCAARRGRTWFTECASFTLCVFIKSHALVLMPSLGVQLCLLNRFLLSHSPFIHLPYHHHHHHRPTNVHDAIAWPWRCRFFTINLLLWLFPRTHTKSERKHIFTRTYKVHVSNMYRYIFLGAK